MHPHTHTREHTQESSGFKVQVQGVLLALHRCARNLTLKHAIRLLNLRAAELELPTSPLSWLRPPQALQLPQSQHQLTRMAKDGEVVGYVKSP